MRLSTSLVALCAVSVLAACVPPQTPASQSGAPDGGAGKGSAGSNGGSGGKAGDTPDLSPTLADKVSVGGIVRDVVGNFIGGANVTLGTRMTQTEDNGRFSFGMITVSDAETLRVSHAGFGPGSVAFSPMRGAPTYLTITLQPAEQAMLQDPSAGGEVTTGSGATLMLPPNSIVDETGAPVTGPVQVSVALINDRNGMAAAPSMLATEAGAPSNAEPATLESFGMVAVDLIAGGRPVSLVDGAAVHISFPLSAGSHFEPGEGVGLWHFDDGSGLWKSDGEGMVDASSHFNAVVSHFSWWNADKTLTKTCVRSRVLDAQGHPIAGAAIQSAGRSYLGSTHSQSDESGNFCIEARVGSVIELSTLVHVGTADQALAIQVSTPRTTASCKQPDDCFELPTPLVAVADQPLCQPSLCPQDETGQKAACCRTALGPCAFVVHGDCGGAEDGSWDTPSDMPGVMTIPGVPMGTLDMSDAGTPAPSGDASTPAPDAAVCGSFFGGDCQQCLATNCTDGAASCFGSAWADRNFDGALCPGFVQCLCDNSGDVLSLCDAQITGLSCVSCLNSLDSCAHQHCAGPCGAGGSGPPPHTLIDRCDAAQALPNLNPVTGTTVGSSLSNDWYENGPCTHSIPSYGYLPGYERVYSVPVPAGLTLRAHVSGAGMFVLIADDCHDVDGHCMAAGTTASYQNASDQPVTVYVTVDNTGVDARGAFTLTLSTAAPACGDGFRDEAEGCDDGARTPSDGCDANCHIEQNWSCPGDTACHPIECGDGIRDDGAYASGYEQCDDGNIVAGDGCNASCEIESYYACDTPGHACRHIVCGDGILDWQYEQCDDHNLTAGDGCNASCHVETGYACPTPGSACIPTICGDGIVGNPEQCDDGNTAAGDGCSSSCQLESGYVCMQPGNPCRAVVCGDSFVDRPYEDCEDGNTTSGDGCSSTCLAEPGYLCDNSGVCTVRPAGDLCSNATSLPAGLHHTAYVLTGMSPDDATCMSCPVTRWFSTVQQPGQVTALEISADFEGFVSLVTDNCPRSPGEMSGWTGFSADHPGRNSIENDTLAVRTLRFAVGGYSASGTFTLTTKTGPKGCGDGVRQLYEVSEAPPEGCDDFNTTGGDGCSSSCQVESGYRCPNEGGSCSQIACGDGIVDFYNQQPQDVELSSGEECDDGNISAGDGCSAQCKVESGSACDGSPSHCQAVVLGDNCSNPLALPIGSSSHDLSTFHAESSCQPFCGGVDVWFSRTLQPREVLDVGVTAPFPGQVAAFAAPALGCAAAHPIGQGDVAFDNAQGALIHAENAENHPITVLVVVSASSADSGSVGSFSLDTSVGIPTEDCKQGPCASVECGDGNRNGNEQCDDGGTSDGDGCSATCVRESGYHCDGVGPSSCSQMLPGDTCDVASSLSDGVYSLIGYTRDDSCEVSCWAPTRWFTVDVPAGQALSLRISTTTMSYGFLRVFDMSRGDCGNLNEAPLGSHPFSTNQLGYGVWVNRGTLARTLRLGIANYSDDESATFSISHTLAPIGCGDGYTDKTGRYGNIEECDDGNTASSDGCSSICTSEPGFDCEQGHCTPIVCGDGVRSASEACDDGNVSAGDGCSASCAVETGYLCGGSPSTCGVLQSGDQCEDALSLSDQSYPLAGYLPDLACENLCSPWIDRWFQVSVPAGQTLSVTATGDMAQGEVVLFVKGSDCAHLMNGPTTSIGTTMQPSPLYWVNTMQTAQDVLLAAVDYASPSTGHVTFSHSLHATGCGDNFVDRFGYNGPVEECDDGNSASGDGCSSTCHIEPGYECIGSPMQCLLPSAGDVCDTAPALSSGIVSLTGYLPAEGCTMNCSGADRWFSVTVPGGMLLDIAVVADSPMTNAQIYERPGADCLPLVPQQSLYLQQNEPGHLRWHNAGGQPAVVVLQLLDPRAWPSAASFDVAYTTAVPSCGDGYPDLGGDYGPVENCDDGNHTVSDGCSDTCTIDSGYHCEGAPSICQTTCGDGLLALSEGCDDNNTTPGDGCSAGCTVESGFGCTGQPSNCQATCGDGLVRGAEQCDDGNTNASDGCDASCHTEGGYVCVGEPSVCGP